ncbi:MAG: thymidine kinase [Mycoplasmoidaceae bacterium]
MAKFNAFHREYGWIELICGPMFAGKSEELLRRIKRLEYADVECLLFKPKIDSRNKSYIKSRNGKKMNAIEFSDPFEIFEELLKNVNHPQVVAIDEIQFADPKILEVIEVLAKKGIIVYAAGLDNDFRNNPFPIVSALASMAEHVTKLSAICTECGAPGTCTQRKIDDEPASYNSPIVLIGNTESYTVTCRNHHKIPEKKFTKNSVKFIKNYKEL